MLWQVFSRESKSRHFCLAHLFTCISMQNGVLGLAYISSPQMFTVGGICSKCKKS